MKCTCFQVMGDNPQCLVKVHRDAYADRRAREWSALEVARIKGVRQAEMAKVESMPEPFRS